MDTEELARLERLYHAEGEPLEWDPGDEYNDYHPEEDALDREEWNDYWYAARGV